MRSIWQLAMLLPAVLFEVVAVDSATAVGGATGAAAASAAAAAAAAADAMTQNDAVLPAPRSITWLRGAAERTPTPGRFYGKVCTGASAALPALECAAWQALCLASGSGKWNQHCGMAQGQIFFDPCGCTQKGKGPGCTNSSSGSSSGSSGGGGGGGSSGGSGSTNTSVPHVSSLLLDNWGLVGSLPDELGHLTALTSLSVARNHLSGSIPATVGNCEKLTNVDVSGNQLTGNLPVSLGRLSLLTSLVLGASSAQTSYCNALSGTLPAEMRGLLRLRRLDVTANKVVLTSVFSVFYFTHDSLL
jgi:hypothetical protein